MDQPQIPQNPQIPQTPPIYDQPPSNGKKPLLIIGLILLLLIVITGAIYAGIKIGEKKTQNLISPTKIQGNPTIVPTADQTANWRTYINAKSGFFIKYPPDAISRDTFDPRDNKPTSYIVDFLLPRKTEKDEIKMLSIEILENPQLLNAKDYFTKDHQTSVAPPPSVVKEEQVKIAGVDSYVVTLNSPNGPPAIVTYIPKANKMFKIYFFEDKGNDSLFEEHTRVFNQMISTFKFLSPASSLQIPDTAAETAGWKIYTNTLYNFELKYPSELTIEQSFEPEKQSSIAISGNLNKSKPNSHFVMNVGYTWGVSMVATGYDAFKSCSSDDECYSIYFEEINRYPRNDLKEVSSNILNKTIRGFEFVDNNQFIRYFPLSRNGKFFLISFNFVNYSKAEIESAQSLLNQILSTFKFL